MPKLTRLALSLFALLFGCDSYVPKPAEHGIFSSCCSGIGTCVPVSAVTGPDAARLGQDACDSSLVCAPTDLVESASYVFETCRSFGQSEGRCLPSCLPEVASEAARLERSTCPEATLCVPCFDPISGDPTGACELGGDHGPTEPPKLFAQCCEKQGRCIPSELVDKDLQSSLAANSCARDTNSLCVPKLWVEDEHAYPATCHGYGGAEGRCMPRCLPDVANRADRLLKDTCQGTDLCVPCFDPITGEDTKACSTGDDPGPKEPAVKFGQCCGALGSCVPNTALRESERAQLSTDGCTDRPDTMCVPSAWVSDPTKPPVTCQAFGELEGRCLPACLPEVSKRLDVLKRDGCAPELVCVPCFDPITLENTGACNVNSDPGPKKLPVSFSLCCEGQGRCVPAQTVDNDDRARLGSDVCTPAEKYLCVPEEWIKSPYFVPQVCTAPGDLEGRCIPDCLPDVAQRGDQLSQVDCPPAHKCVPCFDPVTSESTHACEISTDSPKTAEPKLFPSCCNDSGLCVPHELVAEDAQSHLSNDGCDFGSQALCVPRKWVGKDQVSIPQSCHGHGNAEGRCLSVCLPEIAGQREHLRQDVCPDDELCAPCYDPITGKDTEACRFGGDAPRETPVVYDTCCGARGRCVPGELLEPEDRAELSTDSCGGEELMCVPSNWLGSDPSAPPTCRGHMNGEGRCLPDCLPTVAKQLDRLTTAGCEAQTACVPCYDPVTGARTGACSSPGDPGPTEPARTFPKCCSGIGRCVSSSLVDPQDRGRLSPERCASPATDLCVPASWLTADFSTPPSCRAPGNVEGRCLAACLPEVAARADDLRQTSCASGELCVPCYDPLTGAKTDACTVNGDYPRELPKRYPQCCSGAGTCVPGALLSNTSGLSTDSCPERDTYCVPTSAANGFDPGYPSCTDEDARVGACVPSCFINPWLRLILDPGTCLSGGTMCVACGSLSLDTAVCR